MRCKIFLILVGFFLVINLVCAGFQISDSSIESEYDVSDNLVAQINISFDNESLNSYFNDSIGNSIVLSEFLDLNVDFNGSTNETLQTISSDFQILSFEFANFSMPSTPVNITYKLNFTNETIFVENLSIVSSYGTIDETLDDKLQDLNDLKSKITDFDLFVQKRLNATLDIVGIENKLESLRNAYENASSEEYDEIAQNISEIKIPLTISESATADSINFYPERKNVNLDLLKSIGGGDYELEKEEEYIDSIFAWNQEKLVTKLTFKEITILYSGTQEIDLRIFKFVFDKSSLDTNSYFIIKNIEELEFEENYGKQEKSGYIYIDIYDEENTILFSTLEDVNFIDAPVFIAPSLNDLSLVEVGEYIDTEEEKKFSKWMLFGLIMGLLILSGIVVYVILQLWYKRKYENYLFKNRNNLFNIMNYINDAKKKKMKREDIIKNLKKAKWNSEQITYALRKYEGKRTGMVELPFTKFANKPSNPKK